MEKRKSEVKVEPCAENQGEPGSNVVSIGSTSKVNDKWLTLTPFAQTELFLTIESPSTYAQIIVSKAEFIEWFQTAMRDMEG